MHTNVYNTEQMKKNSNKNLISSYYGAVGNNLSVASHFEFIQCNTVNLFRLLKNDSHFQRYNKVHNKIDRQQRSRKNEST